MTQRQIGHAQPLPSCRAGHTARHIVDGRATRAGGGHFIECPCRHTAKHDDFEIALTEWCRINDKRKSRLPRAGALLQFRLPLWRGVAP